MLIRPSYLALLIASLLFWQQAGLHRSEKRPVTNAPALVTGAARLTQYLPDLRGRNVGVLINNNALLNGQLSIDTLIQSGVKVVKRFGAERELRGKDGNNLLTPYPALPLVYLYGDQHKPDRQDLSGIDVMLVDVQDLGVRFYIYLATLHYVMEACAENDIEVIVLDRPNPIGSMVDGPVLDPSLASFLGTDPLPLAHGLTFGEYAKMINGEGWLKNGIKCKLKVVNMLNYTHSSSYTLSNPPFPNLNSDQAIQLYPSLCWFDGTVMSSGRGTDFPFTVLGHPLLKSHYTFSFTPRTGSKTSTPPPYQNIPCYGLDLSAEPVPQQQISLNWLVDSYRVFPEKAVFFNPEKFDRLAGTRRLREQLMQGLPAAGIRESWKPDLSHYKKIRHQYLMYE